MTQKVDDDLRSLGKFKDIVSNILFHSEDVKNLVMPFLDDDRFDDVDNFFGGKDLKYYNPSTKEVEYVDLTGHCFDVPYIDPTISDTRAVICLESFITKLEGAHLKEVEIDIFAFAHKDFIHMPSSEKGKYSKRGYAGNRVDMITSAIQLAMKERSREFGIGKIELKPINPITPYIPNNDFYGKQMSYLCCDFYTKPKNVRR